MEIVKDDKAPEPESEVEKIKPSGKEPLDTKDNEKVKITVDPNTPG